MSKLVLIEELQLQFHVPRGLSRQAADRVARSLDGTRFHRRLSRAVRAVVRKIAVLKQVQVRITR